MARLTQHWHRIEVTGSHTFPVDMLRYDSCYPLYDTAVIRYSLRGDDIGIQVVALGHWGPSSWVPSYDRWRSYHWNITHHEVMK